MMSRVLILGAGLVAKPLIEYLLEKKISITVASPMKDRADEMIRRNPLGSSVNWSMEDIPALNKMIGENEVTVSLLPYRFHSTVAKICLKNKKHLVTTSYIQQEMMNLSKDASSKGLLFLNEIGLDPGIDHMSAMKIINHIHENGGRVDKFYSLCGALPAPEAADNPLKYKFTWSPSGVIQACMSSAHFLMDNQRIFVDSENLFRKRFSFNFPNIGEMEVYPNRDSISYIDIYGIPEARTMYRGTLRYKGWCETLDVMKRLRMLDVSAIRCKGKTYIEFLAERAGTEIKGLADYLHTEMGITVDSVPFRSLEFLGFFSNDKLEYDEASPFEILSNRMIPRMSLSDNERDMVAMQHIFLAEYPTGKKEVIKSSMLHFGSPSTNTAISRTVALPAAIAVRLILEKKINISGVLRPVVPEIYEPVLGELKILGIKMNEEYGVAESDLRI